MTWLNWLSLKVGAKAPSNLLDISGEAPSQPLECDRGLLAKFWLAHVVQQYAQLEKWATTVGLVINDEQCAMLFKQICLFNDVLWSRYLIPDAILARGRIHDDKIAAYIEQWRIDTMQMLYQDERLPLICRDWSIYGTLEEIKIDHDFYAHGTLPENWEKDYYKIQSAHSMKMDGTSWELLARFHLRVWQILNIFQKFESGYIRQVYELWFLQAKRTEMLVNMFHTKVIPIA
jgi:hypothetical protein